MGALYDLVTSKKQSLAEAARRSLGSIVSKVVETIPPVAALKAATSGGSKESAEALAKFQATPFAQKAGTAIYQFFEKRPTLAQFTEGFLGAPRRLYSLFEPSTPKALITEKEPATKGQQVARVVGEMAGEAPYWITAGKLIEAPLAAKIGTSALGKVPIVGKALQFATGAAASTPILSPFISQEGTLEERFSPSRLAGATAQDIAFSALMTGALKPLSKLISANELKQGAKVIAKFNPETEMGQKLIRRFGEQAEVEILGKPFKVKSGAVLIKGMIGGEEVNLPVSKHLEWFEPMAEKTKRTLKEIPQEGFTPAAKETAEEALETAAEKAPPQVPKATGKALEQAEEAAARVAPSPKAPPTPETPKKLPTEARLTVKASQETNEAAQKLLKKNPGDPLATEDHPRLFKRIGQALREGRISVEAIPELRVYDLTQEEAATLFEQAATYSGRTLERLSRTAKQIQKLFPEQVPVNEVPKTVWDRIASLPKGIINYWRASLVSQLATAVRNVGSQGMRYLLHIVDDAAAGALETVTGKATPRQAFAPMLEDILAIFRRLDKKRLEKLAEVLDYDPIIKGKLYNTPVGDITLGQKAANILNTFNRTQEYFCRNLVFDAVLSGELKRLGLDLAKVSPADIPTKTLLKAVDRALEITYAAAPKARLGRDLVRVVNQYPFLAVLGYPFPRYLTNAVKAIYEFSPLGITRFLSPKYVKMLASGNPREAYHVISRAAIGSILFAAAVYLRNSEHAGEKWYELKFGDKRVDVRPFGPLLPTYLFLAEAMKDPSKMENRDWLEGVLGINRMAGTTLFLTSMLAGQGPDNLEKAIAQFTGEFLGGFSVPFRTLKDFVAFFSDEEKVYRYTEEQPVTGPFLANIPGLQRMLPPSPAITRAEPSQAEYPATRQLTGLTIKTKTPLEAELDRLDIRTYDLLPRTGDPYIDRLITAETGRVIARLGGIVTNPKYQALSEPDKVELLKSIFKDVKKEAKEKVLQEHAVEIAARMRREMEGMTAEEKRAYLEKQRRKGLLQAPIIEALRRPFDVETLRRALERSVQP